MASFGSAKTIGIAALAVVLAHGAVLTLVMVNLPSVTVKSPEVPSLIQILSWKEPLPTTPPTPQAFPSPVQSTPVPLTSEVTEPQPSVAESPLPHPAVEAAPTEIPVSETSYTAATVQAPITAPVPASYAPADVEYLPQSGVTLAPVVPAQDLLKRIHYPDKARKLSIQGTVNLDVSKTRQNSIAAGTSASKSA